MSNDQILYPAGTDVHGGPVLAATAPRTARRLRGMDDESFALTVGAVVFAVTAVVAGFVFWGRELPIDGRGSLGDFTAIASAIAASIAFAVARSVPRHRNRPPVPSARRERYHWFDLVALSLAHGAVALLGWIGIATVMEHSFIGATVYASPAIVIASAATALSAYLAVLSGVNLSPRQLSLVLAVFLVVGMTTAMLSSTDPLWWQMNLSALGITHDISSLTFNLTLIVSGVIITTIARLGTATLPSYTTAQRRRRTAVRVLFVLLGVLLACVGIFPVDRFFLLHNTVATGMTVAFAALVIGLPWLVPTMPKAFVVLGFVYVGVVIVLAVLFAAGVYNLTAVELVSSLLIFSWIILFLRNVQTNAQLEESH
ncbi:hypothetical protein [Agromyces cerinus]|uniref:Hypothetical membrane protein n=1 Tax=Agromyces cerinus subsp. cerinus TaxID=232089 RepID=A0A1N6IB86_9MICO|nr:hypothetical protein [Agromyces cerinus]SIO29260.1 hypothetical membrane protein [Agromyces cerinus subsp. cerinus]